MSTSPSAAKGGRDRVGTIMINGKEVKKRSKKPKKNNLNEEVVKTNPIA